MANPSAFQRAARQLRCGGHEFLGSRFNPEQVAVASLHKGGEIGDAGGGAGPPSRLSRDAQPYIKWAGASNLTGQVSGGAPWWPNRVDGANHWATNDNSRSRLEIREQGLIGCGRNEMRTAALASVGAAALFVALTTSPSAGAATVVWRVSGHVTQIEGANGLSTPAGVAQANQAISQVGGAASLGDTFTITYAFDPAIAYCTICGSPNTEERWANPITETVFSVGTWTRTLVSQSDDRFTPALSNNEIDLGAADPHIGYLYVMYMAQWLDDLDGRGSQISAGWFAQGTTYSPSFVTSTQIPTAPFNLGAYSFLNGPQMQISLAGIGPLQNNTAFVIGVADSVSLATLPPPTPSDAVPEPASWALMITGFGLAGAGRRRRQSGRPVGR